MFSLSRPDIRALFLLALAFITQGVAHAQPTTPASFSGDLPCADCSGIRWHLDLLPDSTFFLRTTYLDDDSGFSFDEIGRWQYTKDGNTLELQGPREYRPRFLIEKNGNLHKLDQEGKPIESSFNYQLQRLSEFSPIEPRLPLSGMYSYFADSGMITLCETGQRLPVAQEADNQALESTYIKTRTTPGEALLVTIDGRIAQRMPMEGPGPRPTLVVERFQAIWPHTNCEDRHSLTPVVPVTATKLQDTHWQLIALNQKPITIGEGERQAHLILDSEGHVSGSSGCNRMMGSYTQDENTLKFGPLAGTRMACMGDDMPNEHLFLTTLGNVTTWEIVGKYLDLKDSSGKTLLRFEAQIPR